MRCSASGTRGVTDCVTTAGHLSGRHRTATGGPSSSLMTNQPDTQVPVGCRRTRPATCAPGLQKLALSGDSAEAMQPNELQEHHPSVPPEGATLCK
jgi:hypothetical protein